MSTDLPPHSSLVALCRRLQKSILGAGFVAVLAGLFSSALSVVLWKLAPLPADLSREDQFRYQAWKDAMYADALKRPFIYVFLLVFVAGFASTFPPSPVRFTRSVGILALVAVIAHGSTLQLQGPNDVAVCIALAVAGGALTILGFEPTRQNEHSENA